jgi:hypothetical protein
MLLRTLRSAILHVWVIVIAAFYLITAWGIKPFILLPSTYSNCLVYAVGQWWRQGGGILFVPSVHGWWLHVVHYDRNGVLTEYVPKKVAPRFFRNPTWYQRLARVAPPILFDGYVRPFTRKL